VPFWEISNPLTGEVFRERQAGAAGLVFWEKFSMAQKRRRKLYTKFPAAQQKTACLSQPKQRAKAVSTGLPNLKTPKFLGAAL
jgi:hypothetical protein